MCLRVSCHSGALAAQARAGMSFGAHSAKCLAMLTDFPKNPFCSRCGSRTQCNSPMWTPTRTITWAAHAHARIGRALRVAGAAASCPFPTRTPRGTHTHALGVLISHNLGRVPEQHPAAPTALSHRTPGAPRTPGRHECCEGHTACRANPPPRGRRKPHGPEGIAQAARVSSMRSPSCMLRLVADMEPTSSPTLFRTPVGGDVQVRHRSITAQVPLQLQLTCRAHVAHITAHALPTCAAHPHVSRRNARSRLSCTRGTIQGWRTRLCGGVCVVVPGGPSCETSMAMPEDGARAMHTHWQAPRVAPGP